MFAHPKDSSIKHKAQLMLGVLVSEGTKVGMGLFNQDRATEEDGATVSDSKFA